MMRLLENITDNTTGAEAFITNRDAGSFMMFMPAAANLGGGTLTLQLATLEEVLIVQSSEFTFLSPPEPELVFIPAGVKIRAQLTGAAGPNIPFFDLIPADSEDKNRPVGRI